MTIYRLSPSRLDDVPDFSPVTVVTSKETFVIQLPIIPDLAYAVLPDESATFSVRSDHFDVRRSGMLLGLIDRLRPSLRKRKRILRYGPVTIAALGVKPARRRLWAVIDWLRKTGQPLDGLILRRFPEIVQGWSHSSARSALSPALESGGDSARVAVVLHLYYADLWPEIAGVLRKIDRPFDLIVTTVPDRDALVGEIRQAFPNADVRIEDNRGRDIRPFLVLLEEGRLDRYDLVCKIHGKKSRDGGRNSTVGNLWRNQLLFDLLAAPGVVDEVVGRFGADKALGILGSASFRFPNRFFTKVWGPNKDVVTALAGDLGVTDFKLDFFGGSMFWCRPEALKRLRNLGLAKSFPKEQGFLDGGLEHAVERLFTTSATAAGFTIGTVSGADVRA